MPMLNTLLFKGRFSNIPTYVMNMGATKPPGGIASEALEALGAQIKDTFGNTSILSRPYDYPAFIDITGNPDDVSQADTFTKTELNRHNATYTYTP